ncbi:hypothetical protein [Methanobacterium sp.]|uniref:hypothetical protein n=1 Tax=Methanobacterium sp. TaxID=2164 RepID=UPI002ABC4EC3|nr:hypothetical protein [Methanobacterium sp.]MDY9922800.1 hypothetical protein [Methanobacterium sp.]
MTVTAELYGNAEKNAWLGKINFEEDYIKVMLCTNQYTPDQDTHEFKSDITNEVTGTGYIVGGQRLFNCAVTYDPVTKKIKLDSDDIIWLSSSITARYAVFYADIVSAEDTAKPLICFWDFGQDETDTAGSFTLELSTDGIVMSTVGATA